MVVEYAPRPEFGLVQPALAAAAGAVVARGGPTVLMLSTTATMDLAGATASATVALGPGDEVAFALEQARAFGSEPAPWGARKIRRGLAAAEAIWKSWSDLHQRHEGPHRALVHHSGVVLQGLTYARTGAVIAAPTISLPEGEGSGRTWDYRYTWVRDASMTRQGLWIAACPDEAGRFFAFLATAASTQLTRAADLQIMFGVGAERDLSEHELAHLAGWRGSGPLRTGNGAWDQRQLDVYGALLDAAFTLRGQLGDLPETTRRFLVAAVEAAAGQWPGDDQGIWEMRGPPRPYLHSKLMCWVAVDRGLAMVDIGLAGGWVPGGHRGPQGRLGGQQQADPSAVAAEELRVPYRKKKRPLRGIGTSVGAMCPIGPNVVWALDFQFDQTTDGKMLKLLNVIDEYTRECLAIDVDRCVDADGVVRCLQRLAGERGAPAHVRTGGNRDGQALCPPPSNFARTRRGHPGRVRPRSPGSPCRGASRWMARSSVPPAANG